MKAIRISFIFAFLLPAVASAMWNGKDATYKDDLTHFTAALGVSQGALDIADGLEPDPGSVLGNWVSFCSGTFVAPHTILTAAHCIVEGTGSRVALHQLRVLVGPSSVEHVLTVSSALVGPTFDKSHPENGDDLALVYFSESIPDSYAVAPLAPENSLQTVSSVIVAGYGQPVMDDLNRSGNSQNSPLHWTQNPLVNIAYSPWGATINETKGGPCSGDSGGPVFVSLAGKLALVGANQAVSDDCRDYSVFTKIDVYRDWIQSHLQ
jgi:secreted trypsin-like serine protease